MSALAWPFMILAVLCEVTGTLSLRMASAGRRPWILPVVAGYVLAFTFLSLALAAGMALGVAYGIWTALGVALIAILGRVLFGDPLTPVMRLGVVLVIGGVLLIELGAAH